MRSCKLLPDCSTDQTATNRLGWRCDPPPGGQPLTGRASQAMLWAALLLLATAPTGCQKSELLGKVSGKVTFQGEPVSEGLVLLVNAEQGIHLTAKLGTDGSFDVKSASGDGLPPGTYQIAITPPRVEFPIDPTEPVPIVQEHPNIPGKYHNAATSELTLDVKEGDNRLDVDMTP